MCACQRHTPVHATRYVMLCESFDCVSSFSSVSLLDCVAVFRICLIFCRMFNSVDFVVVFCLVCWCCCCFVCFCWWFFVLVLVFLISADILLLLFYFYLCQAVFVNFHNFCHSCSEYREHITPAMIYVLDLNIQSQEF